MSFTIVEVVSTAEGQSEYLSIAFRLGSFLENRDGFVSIKHFRSLVDERKHLGLSFWCDVKLIEIWRILLERRLAQQKGKSTLCESYRIRVAQVVRDYTAEQRAEAPGDSNDYLT